MSNYGVVDGIWVTDGSQAPKDASIIRPRANKNDFDKLETVKIDPLSKNKIVCWISASESGKRVYVKGEIKSKLHYSWESPIESMYEEFTEKEVKNNDPKYIFWSWPNSKQWMVPGIYYLNLKLGYPPKGDIRGETVWEKEIQFIPFNLVHKK